MVVASSSVGTTFSMLAMTICTRGRVWVRSPLPSLVTRTNEPVSAMSRLAPVMPTSAARNSWRSTARASASSTSGSVGAGDAHLGGEELLAQHGTRFRQQHLRLLQRPGLRVIAVMGAEGVRHLVFRQVHGRGDDVARRLVAELDDVFAEVGLDRAEALLLQELVDPDLLADHRLPLGDRVGARVAADLQHRLPGRLRIATPVHVRAVGLRLLGEPLQVEVEVGEGMVLDVPGRPAELVELRHPLDGEAPLDRKTRLEPAQRLLQLDVVKGAMGVLDERVGGGVQGVSSL